MLYKTTKTKEKRWGLIATALLINALDAESYILVPFGIPIKQEAYDIASSIPDFLIASLLVWGGIQLKKERSEFKDVVGLGIYATAAYIWLFLLATEFFDKFESSFAIKFLFPYFALGASLIYLGHTLRNYVISKSTLEELFPIGLILLGAINLTYPFTRNVESFASAMFLLAAIFRLMAAVGALKFAIYPAAIFAKPKEQMPSKIKGAFMFKSKEELKKAIPNFFSQNVVVITRDLPRNKVPENTLVYWLTKMEENTKADGNIYTVSPTRIDVLIHLLTKNLKSGYNAVYIDGFEYLMIENGFDSAVKFLFDLKDRVLSEGKVIALVVDPRTLTDKQIALLEREFSNRIGT
ncbi:DUF835 domain-containing protein [Thermococcus aggregans]|uniref:DUF835 domain-containing protein n=1 Tax=Thermococcus aggregans TaxID=110163 RepID=A0A9E7MYU4_THEAG|nr:DUF835 domain-containing protein [Thermococcus aggregans]USS41344.1 DUF835 domain-containing protein [Thermococcus aggregans]